MTDKLQEAADRLVRNEVRACVSTLVSTLAEGAGGFGELGMIRPLCEQAVDLCSPVLDYEEAARQAGWAPVGPDNWRNESSETSGFSMESPEAICSEFNIDPYEWEIYEHWVVSDWLAEKLEAEGERVDRDFADLCVWGRTTTGQGIAMDGVILRIAARMISPEAP